jgi:DNA recombination protein RmuC
MNKLLHAVAGIPASPLTLLSAATLLFVVFVAVVMLVANRARRAEAAAAGERQRQLDDKMAALGQVNAELTGRLQTMAEVLSSRQSDLARLVSERLDAVGSRVGQGLEHSAKSTADHLLRLNERLAVIDAAQSKLTGLTEEVIGLKDILSNKQARGAFGQGRMEAIVRDGLPAQTYEFQFTLTNKTRPDCVIRLPGDSRLMVIDAKFPLESFTAFKGAANEDERRQAAARIRTDLGKHVRDIAERYFIAGETQDIAILFVPSESIYADLNEHFDDVVQRAHKARIIIVSPSLLMMAIQVMQAIVRDARMREQAHLIQAEVRNLVEDVGRLRERVAKLDGHFRLAGEDIAQIAISSDKIAKRGDRIDQMDLTPTSDSPPTGELKLVADAADAGRGVGPASSSPRSGPGNPNASDRDHSQTSTRRTTQR